MYSSDLSDEDEPYTEPYEKKKKFRPIDKNVCAAADCANISSRGVMAIVSQVSGLGREDIVISSSTIHRARKKNRFISAAIAQESFKPQLIPLTVHWDAKKYKSLADNRKINRVAVLVVGDKIQKLLGVVIASSGSGSAEAAEILKLLKQWNVTNNVKGMCFDTTASNSGLKNGSCAIIERSLGRQLYSYACRHHILELIIGAVYNEMFGKSSSPIIELFERFSNAWHSMDNSKFSSAMTDRKLSAYLETVKFEMTDFVRQQMAQFQPRDDYFELLNLVLAFFGSKTLKVKVVIMFLYFIFNDYFLIK